MPRTVYEALRERVLESDGYFLQKQDALGKLCALFCRPDQCSLTNSYVNDNSCLISE
jgi:hypothetical protein